MFPAGKETEAVQSGTGVFYQAIPAVGADGKNIMKLIPVQMVNGKFFRTVISKPKVDHKPWRPRSRKVTCPPLDSSASQQVVKQQITRQQVSLGSTFPNPVTGSCLELGSQRKEPFIAPLTTNPGMSVRLPVNVKSPVLPRGQYLQIPSDAQVRTVPVSQLPPAVKKQIFTSTPSSSSSLPSVVYVSPVSTVHQSSSVPDVLSEASHITSPSSGGSKPRLRLVPKVSQRPNSPIKWMIEEEDDDFGVLTPDPLISPSVTSEIIRAVAEREVANKHCETLTKEMPVSPSNKEGREDALVMCNGKVFFVANKNRPFKSRCGKVDPPATKSYQGKLSSKSVLRQDTIIIPDESNEVIDLCNDDCSDDLSGHKSTVTHLNEDNVIFVSYIPPKSESGTKHLIHKAAEKQTDKMDSSNSVMELKSCDVGTSSVSEILIDSPALMDHSDVTEGSSFPRRRETRQSMLFTNVCGAALINIHNSSNSNTHQSSSPQQLQSSGVDLEGESSAAHVSSDSSSGIFSQTEDTCKSESSTDGASSLAPEPCHTADHLLRQIFGIAADVRVSLQRIDEVSASSVLEEALQNQSKWATNEFLQDFYHKRDTEQPSGLIRVSCSLFKQTTNALTLKRKYPLGQRPHKRILIDIQSEPVFSYVEPIDDDLSITDEHGSQDSAFSQTQVCVNPNTRRMGRARKRTMCPCCIPGALDPAGKSRLEKTERWAWSSKKGGRMWTKAQGKGGKTPGRIDCVTAKNKQSCKIDKIPASS